MKPYSTVRIKEVEEGRLMSEVRGESLVLAVDVGKETMVGALLRTAYDAVIRIRWEHPSETRERVSLMGRLGAKSIQVALEPSGTYGDSVRHQFARARMLVFRVSPLGIRRLPPWWREKEAHCPCVEGRHPSGKNGP